MNYWENASFSLTGAVMTNRGACRHKTCLCVNLRTPLLMLCKNPSILWLNAIVNKGGDSFLLRLIDATYLKAKALDPVWMTCLLMKHRVSSLPTVWIVEIEPKSFVLCQG